MKRRLIGLGFVALLAACGGGGGAGGGGGLPPSGGGGNTSTPSPTPSPTPSAAGSSSPVPGTAATLPPVEAPQYGWSPYDVASKLQFPVQIGWDGSGQTVAIVIDSFPTASDVSTYTTQFQIPLTSRTITYAPGPDGTPDPTADQSEATLDVETVAGLAPGANVIVYGMPSLSQQIFTDTVNYVTSNHTASVISFSAGGCEYPGVTSDAVFQAAAAAGIAIVASAGDNGNECYSSAATYVPGVAYPASDTYVTGLGGTETDYPSDTLTSNTVWNDSACTSGQCAGGGGVSAYFALPLYQQGLAGITSSTNRNVPDISLPAMGDQVYQGGKWAGVGGTSWSAPQYAAMLAEIYEYCRASITNPETIPYSVFAKNKSAFIDVVSGNDQFGTSTPFYTAAAGYDNASGLGVPLGVPLANSLCPNRTPSLARLSAYAAPQHSGAYAVDVTPRVAGLRDIGRRSVQAQTRVQIALRNTGNMTANEAAVVASLQQAGFTIVRTFSNHLIVDALAPSGTVESYFGTELHDMQQGRFGTRYMPVRTATVPASIAPFVSAINLDDVITMRHR